MANTNISIQTSRAMTDKGEKVSYSFDIIQNGKVVSSAFTSDPQKAKVLLQKYKQQYKGASVNGKADSDPFEDGAFAKQSDIKFGGFQGEDDYQKMSGPITEKSFPPIAAFPPPKKGQSIAAGKSNNIKIKQDVRNIAQKRFKTFKTNAGTTWENLSKDKRAEVGLNGNLRLQAHARRPKAESENVIRGIDNNAFIILGNDRVEKLHTGYGGTGFTQCDAIDLVAGLGGPEPTEVIRDSNGKLKFDEQGNQELADTNPNFFMDAARIYISQRTNVDKNFGIGPWAQGKKTEDEVNDPENIGKYGAKSAIAAKADNIRVIGRESLRLVTGTDAKNSQGGDVGGKSGVEIVAMNNLETLQPMVLGDNLQLALITIIDNIEAIAKIFEAFTKYQMKFNQAMSKHNHITPFAGKPDLPSRAAVVAGIKVDIETFSKTSLSVVKHITNLQGVKHNFLQPSGDGYINSPFNKVN